VQREEAIGFKSRAADLIAHERDRFEAEVSGFGVPERPMLPSRRPCVHYCGAR
jgi:hypothetical protein